MLKASYDMWCDRCGCWVNPMGLRGHKALRWAKREGWTRTRTEGDLCPSCNGSDPSYWASWGRGGSQHP